MYTDEETLELTHRVAITQKVKELIDKEKKRLYKEEGRKLSRAKIVSNLIIGSFLKTKELDK